MINSNKIKGRMREMNITQAQLAKKIGISESTCCLKINNLRALSLDEANIVADCLQISPDEFRNYFFANNVANRNPI